MKYSSQVNPTLTFSITEHNRNGYKAYTYAIWFCKDDADPEFIAKNPSQWATEAIAKIKAQEHIDKLESYTKNNT